MNNSGLATAVVDGTTRITATTDGVSGFTYLVVKQLPTIVVVTPQTGTLTSLGDTIRLSVAAQDARVNPLAL